MTRRWAVALAVALVLLVVLVGVASQAGGSPRPTPSPLASTAAAASSTAPPTAAPPTATSEASANGQSAGPVGPSPSPRPAALPDPVLTPGAANPDVTPATIGSTICRSGWTATVRPPSSYTSKLKVVQIGQYGYADLDPSHYEEDHLVPLELGGAPRDPLNLWPEPHVAFLADGTPVGYDVKDHLENDLKRLVCAGSMDLRVAQQGIAGDWIAAWRQLGSP